MSETTTLPFQPGTMAAAPAVPQPEESPGNKRLLLILGALAGLAVLAIAAYFLLFAGGSDNNAPAAPAPAPNAGAQPSTAPSAAPKTAALPAISKRNFGTDPFKALISVGTTGPVAGTAPTGATAPVATAPVAPTPVTTTPATTPVTTTPAASQSYRFTVVKVAGDNSTINVRVNGKHYDGLRAGKVFAKIFKVRFIGGNVNAFQIGDEVFNVVGSKVVTISS